MEGESSCFLILHSLWVGLVLDGASDVHVYSAMHCGQSTMETYLCLKLCLLTNYILLKFCY